MGDELTNPNGNLLSERATGWEAGLVAERAWGTIRSSYFVTEVNRPITALTVNGSSSPILLVRENLGQIESRGLSLDYELRPRRWLAVDGGYQYAHAVVSRGSQDYGKWIPEVARNLATLNARAYKPALGTLNLEGRVSWKQYDDDANVFLLSGYFRLMGSMILGAGLSCLRRERICWGDQLRFQRRLRLRWGSLGWDGLGFWCGWAGRAGEAR